MRSRKSLLIIVLIERKRTKQPYKSINYANALDLVSFKILFFILFLNIDIDKMTDELTK